MQSLKTQKDLRKLEKEMYDVANIIIGDKYPRKEKAPKASTGENYDLFGIFAETLDEIMPIWKNWINSYCIFKKLNAPEHFKIERNPKLFVYWCKYPTITHQPAFKKMNKDMEIIEEGPLTYFVRSYLLISRRGPYGENK